MISMINLPLRLCLALMLAACPPAWCRCMLASEMVRGSLSGQPDLGVWDCRAPGESCCTPEHAEDTECCSIESLPRSEEPLDSSKCACCGDESAYVTASDFHLARFVAWHAVELDAALIAVQSGPVGARLCSAELEGRCHDAPRERYAPTLFGARSLLLI